MTHIHYIDSCLLQGPSASQLCSLPLRILSVGKTCSQLRAVLLQLVFPAQATSVLAAGLAVEAVRALGLSLVLRRYQVPSRLLI